MSKTSNLFGPLECKMQSFYTRQKKTNRYCYHIEMYDTLCVPILTKCDAKETAVVWVRWSVKWFIGSSVQQTFIMQFDAILKIMQAISMSFLFDNNWTIYNVWRQKRAVYHLILWGKWFDNGTEKLFLRNHFIWMTGKRVS